MTSEPRVQASANRPAHPHFDYARDDETQRIRVTARVPLSAEDLIAIVNRQAADKTWTYAVVYDLRAIGAGATSREDSLLVHAHVCQCTELYGVRGPVALVSRTMGMIGAGAAYAMEAIEHGGRVQVFWDLDEAVEWLDHGAKMEGPLPD